MEFGFLYFFFKFIHFHQLNDELDKHKERSSDDVNYDKSILFSLDNSSEKLLEKIKPRGQQHYFSTSSIYNNNSLMLPKLRHKSLL